MDTISTAAATAAAAVTGARHLRGGRNGQDAAAAWAGQGAGAGAGAGAIVVCDGCGSGHSSEVGARLGARLVIAALADELAAGAAPAGVWDGVRARVGAVLGELAAAMPGPREQVVHDHFLFTVVAAAWRGDEVAVWALGDGGYMLGERVEVLGPFPDNQPPYLAYDLLGAPARAHLEVAGAACGRALVATDGAAEVGLPVFAAAIDHALAHPDALRRQLARLARGTERVDWDARRIDRAPAPLQDDGAVAILRWRPRGQP